MPKSIVENNNFIVRMHVLAAVLTLLLLPPFAAFAATYQDVKGVPNVQLVDKNNYVSDPESIIGEPDKAEINRVAAKMRQATGTEIAVVVLPDIGDNEPRRFANELFNSWGVGSKGSDTGLLILLITEPPNRSITFETGYGLEAALPDAVCHRLQQEYMLPDFKAEHFGAGLRQGVSAVARHLSLGSKEEEEETPDRITSLPDEALEVEIRQPQVSGSPPQDSAQGQINSGAVKQSKMPLYLLLFAFAALSGLVALLHHLFGSSSAARGEKRDDFHDSGGSSRRDDDSGERGSGGASDGWGGGGSGGGGARNRF